MTGQTVGDSLRECGRLLGAAGVSEADAVEIISWIAGIPKSRITTSLASTLGDESVERIRSAAVLRAAGAPIQYAVGQAAFRQLILNVNRSVLIPRPETEVLVDIVLSRHGRSEGVAADLGTGSGAIALSLAQEGKFKLVIATDESDAALEVALANARSARDSLHCEVQFRRGHWTAALAGESVDVLVSNPPYIARAEMAELPAEVREWEPLSALESGGDGLDASRAIALGAADVMRPDGLIVLEVDSRRADAAAGILKGDGRYEDVEVIPDLTGRSRFVAARRR